MGVVGEQGVDLVLQGGRVGFAGNASDDPATSIQENHRWDIIQAEVLDGLGSYVDKNWITDLVFPDNGINPVQAACFIDRCAKYDQALAGIAAVEPGKGRHLVEAGRAPGGPEIENDDLAMVLAEGMLPSVCSPKDQRGRHILGVRAG